MADTYDPTKPNVHVEFYTDAVENPGETRKQGRPIFVDREFVRIKLVGDNKNTLIAPAHSACGRDRHTNMPITYAERFPEHYRYFKDGGGVRLDGTPLTEVPWITAARREELKHFNILTVEGLAQLDGANLARIGMGGRELKNRAQAWLDAAAGSADNGRMAAELAAQADTIADLQRQLRQLTEQGASGLGGPGATVVTPQPSSPPVTVEDSPFEAWEDADIKNWLRDNGGSVPPGNPGHKKLVAAADERNFALRTAQAGHMPNAKAA